MGEARVWVIIRIRGKFEVSITGRLLLDRFGVKMGYG